MHSDGRAAREAVNIGGRRVVAVRGTRSQTVSICTERNQRGGYEARYRLPIEVDIRPEDLAELPDLDALRTFLEYHNGVLEGPGPVPGARLPDLIGPPTPEDRWVRDAQSATDRAVSALVDEFRQKPYLHRVEHSLHARLHALLTSESILSQEVELQGGQRTQLVHKEWPETTPRDSATQARHRGLFDLAVLAPTQLTHASLDQFRQGRISPPIAIEVGLDYGLRHLKQDIEKLKNSEVPCSYIVHLSRVPVRDRDDIESALLELPDGCRAAYVQLHPTTGGARYKHVDQTEFHES